MSVKISMRNAERCPSSAEILECPLPRAAPSSIERGIQESLSLRADAVRLRQLMTSRRSTSRLALNNLADRNSRVRA
jgi:hypothetical protein